MRSDASLADRHNPLSFGLFGLTCGLRVRRIVPYVERAVYAPSPRLVKGRRRVTAPVIRPLSLSRRSPRPPVMLASDQIAWRLRLPPFPEAESRVIKQGIRQHSGPPGAEERE